MVNMYLVPQWFFGYDVLLELVFALVTMLVCVYAFKVYKLVSKEQLKLFGLSFLFISISYFVQSLLNLLIIEEINDSVPNAIKLANINTFNMIGVYAHILFFATGLMVLAYMTFRTTNIKLLVLMTIMTYALLWFSSNLFYSFYFISSIFLAYIVLHYLSNYIKHRQKRTLLVLVAFVFLLFGSIHFIFAMDHSLFYALGHMLGLIAYILILINLIIVIRK